MRYRAGLVALVIVGGAGCATVPQRSALELQDGSLDEALAAIDRRASAEVAKQGWQDLAIGIISRGKLLWWRGYGELDSKSHAKVTNQSYFRLGSITKVFTGLALLQLQEAGKLSLDDPLEKYVPELGGVVYPTAEHSTIRLRDIVRHTTGLPSWFKAVDYTDPGRLIQESDLVGALTGLNLEATPGATKGYSNYANCLSGLVIHRVSGVPYHDWIAERIAKPLGMHLYWSPETVPTGRLAVGHDIGPDKKSLVEVPVGWRLGACDSAGGLYASLDDLTAFASFELGAWPPRDEPEQSVATRATLRESQTAQGKDFGVNWIVHDDDKELGRIVWHNGGIGGYVAVFFLVPDSGFAAVGLLGDGRFDSSGDRLKTLIRDAIAEVEPFLPDGQPALSPEVRLALERLSACIEPDGPLPTKWLSPHLRQLFKPGELEPFVQSGRRMGGHCKLRRVLESDPLKATVRLACSNGVLDLYARVLPDKPHLIDGWTMGPAH